MRHSNPVSATLRGIADRWRGASEVVTLRDSDRLDGKTALVTGANSGLGKATAIALAARGARVVMACRSGVPEAGVAVSEASGSTRVDMVQVDLADPASIQGMCRELAGRGERFDVVVCNAGVMPRAARRAASGFELMFAVNYLANVLLLGRLVDDDLLRTAPGAPPRIVIIASESHRSAEPLDFATIGDYVDYGMASGMRQYAHTKLLLCTYAAELARRLDGTAAVHCMCPGPVASNIAREAPLWAKPILGAVFRVFFKSPARAAEPVVYLCCSPELRDRSGVYLHAMAPAQPSDEALDPDNGARLWAVNQALIARAEAACS